MTKEVKVIKEGYEGVVEVLEKAINEIETNRDAEIERIIAEIEAKYADRLNDYKNDLARYVHIELVEEPDELLEEPKEESAEELVESEERPAEEVAE